ncbi:hypothetical protein ATCC90586_001659 [Pythium insidiosum]|nr:hypothetical protein ATCC90586_001659 [Pythium insidiosum]
MDQPSSASNKLRHGGSSARAVLAPRRSIRERTKRAASLPMNQVAAPRLLSLVTKAPPWVLAKAKKEHLFQLEAAAALPVLNLRRTLSWLALSPERNLRFLRWTKRRFRELTLAHRVGGLLGLATLAVPVAAQHSGVMWTLALSSLVLTTPASFCTAATLSLDMVALLLRHYEFWFFTAVNALTWSSLAVLVGWDPRLLCLASTWGSAQLWVLMDANFRTFVPAVKTCVLALPVLFALALVASLRVLGIADARYLQLMVVRCRVDVVDVFLNALLTLLVFFLRKTYNKRRLLKSRNANTHVVRCVVVRAALVSRSMLGSGRGSSIAEAAPVDAAPTRAAPTGGNAAKDRRSTRTRTRVVLKKLGITAHKVVPGLRLGRPLHHNQQLTLVSLRLNTIDVRRTVWPSCAPRRLQPRRPRAPLVLLYTVGALGLLCSSAALLLPTLPGLDSAVRSSGLEGEALPLTGLGCTLVFCSAFAGAYQRDVVRALLRSFTFLFPSLQVGLAALCLADAVRWDARTWAIAAFFLWFHWILLVDALTPPVRAALGFRKAMAVPVVVSVWVGIAAVVVAILVDSPALLDRELFRWRLASRQLTAGTKMLLLNRVLTLALWTARLLWQVVTARDAELVLLRGTLDYYSPFDTFTGLRRGLSLSAVAPDTRPLPRRDSEGSIILPNESSFAWRNSSFKQLLGVVRRSGSSTQLCQAPSDLAAAMKRPHKTRWRLAPTRDNS